MFSEKDRQIFSYFNGAKEVFADPLALYRRMFQVFGGDPVAAVQATEPQPLPEGIQEEPPELKLLRLDAEERFLEGVREIFRLVPFDENTGKGATEANCWAVWNAFQEFLEGNGSRAGNLPISSAATESCPAPSTFAATSSST